MHRLAKSPLLGLSLAAIFLTNVPLALSADIKKNEQAIREVAEGRRDVAHAAWWGYDAEDATAALQAAINSGVKKVIIEKMSGPWIVNKIQLVSDQELFFEPGVVVQAKKGAFHGRTDSLFSAWKKKNMRLIGPGATLRMHRDDYDNPDKYEKAEWRHAINLHGCENVTILGLTVAESGGDGIYLGTGRKREPCKNIVIRDVVCDKNYRQGISVISVDNLLIENCVLKNTAGTAPAAGIDFEPNHAAEQLTNCVMRNCQIENNAGFGIHVYLRPLNGTSKPVSMRIENCVTRGTNSRSINIAAGCGQSGTVKGSIDVVHCQFEDQGRAGLIVQSKSPNGFRLRYVDCIIADTTDKSTVFAPIQFATRKGDLETTGGVEFENLTVCEKIDRPLMNFHDVIGMNLKDITGNITVKRDEKTAVYQLTPKIVQKWVPFNRLFEIPVIPIENLNLKPLAGILKPSSSKLPPHRLRSNACYMLHARSGDEVHLSLKHQAVGKKHNKPMTISILTPNGKELKSIKIEPDQNANVSFSANQTGVFTVACPSKQNTVRLLSSSHPACIAAIDGQLHMLSTTGKFYFVVPSEARKFGLQLQGSGTREQLSATIYDSTNKIRWQKQNIDYHAGSLLVEREPSNQDEVWRVEVTRPSVGVLEDWFLHIHGIPAILGFDPQNLLSTCNAR